MSRLVWVCLAIALAGCQTGGAGNALGLCTAVCRCAEGQLPSQQRACVEQCVSQSDVREAPLACEECVFENDSSCRDLIQVCFDFNGPCNQPGPDPGPGPVPPDDVPSL